MKFVIIGGDAAGMSAASRAKRIDSEVEVIVLEQTGDVSYSACGMPYNIADPERDIEELVVRRAEVFREKQGIDLRTGHEVESIDRERQIVTGTTVEGESFEVAWDELLIATGARPIRPSIPGADLEGVMVLKRLQDGARFKELLEQRKVSRVVIAGAGYIGLEMCEALRRRGLAVEVVELSPRLLSWLPDEMVEVVNEELERHQVKLHLGQGIEGIEQVEGQTLRVRAGEQTLEGELVLLALGIQPNSELAAEAGLRLGPAKSIAIDRSMRTSVPQIYAAGDCADAFHQITGERVWIPLALRANRAGKAVADVALRGTDIQVPGVAGTMVFRTFELEVARTGLTEVEARESGFEATSVTIKARSRAHGQPGASPLWVHMVGDRGSGRLLGAQLVGHEGAAHRINAPAVALGAGLTVDQFASTDTAYAPPFSPTWDPMLIAANQLLKRL